MWRANDSQNTEESVKELISLRESLIYAASAIDCEGAIQVAKALRKTDIAGYHYSLSVTLDMVDPEIPLWLGKTFGGSNYFYPRSGRRSDIYRWAIYSREARNFLEGILPFMKTKKIQAELAIKFQEMKSNYPPFSEGHHKPLAMLEAEAV